MTEAQRKDRIREFIKREKRMLAYFKRNEEEPDGSFLMDAFIKGYEFGISEMKGKGWKAEEQR